ncbi:hypothetical protein [Streptomyces sp. NPDC003247]|uniref:hypothetical protein n=1 Tax=Streptomyces sp. NPDC003247 TaxID=3364677 RepID=UPI0036CFAD91
MKGARLLPWPTPEGKPCYVVGDGTGHVSRLADEIEGIQLHMADELLQHADALLAEHGVSSGELTYLARRLTESLRDVRRVAESRGARLEQGDGAAPDTEVGGGECATPEDTVRPE